VPVNNVKEVLPFTYIHLTNGLELGNWRGKISLDRYRLESKAAKGFCVHS
jgi:hypothetical protein